MFAFRFSDTQRQSQPRPTAQAINHTAPTTSAETAGNRKEHDEKKIYNSKKKKKKGAKLGKYLKREEGGAAWIKQAKTQMGALHKIFKK